MILGVATDLCTAAQASPVRPPRKIKDAAPAYPTKSLSAGDEGIVVVELKVAASGSVADARVIWSKCPALNDAALTAVRRWQYEKVTGQWRGYGICRHDPSTLQATRQAEVSSKPSWRLSVGGSTQTDSLNGSDRRTLFSWWIHDSRLLSKTPSNQRLEPAAMNTGVAIRAASRRGSIAIR
jgi:TonB family protein